MKLAFSDDNRYIADPEHLDIFPQTLLDPNYLSERAKLINSKRAQIPTFGTPTQGDTVYLSAADAFGMMVSFIQLQDHLQMVLRIGVCNQNPQTASDAPRWFLLSSNKVGIKKDLTQRH